MRLYLVRVTLLLAAALCFVAPAGAGAASLVTYQLPSGGSIGGGLVADPNGSVWFSTTDTAGTQPRLGRLDAATAVAADPAAVAPADAGAKLFPTPTFAGASCCATQIRTLDWDPSLGGRVWFARSDGMYGYAGVGELVEGSSGGFHYGLTPSTQRAGLWGLAYDDSTKQTWLTEYTAHNAVPSGSAAGYYPGNRVAITSSGLGITELTNLAQQPDPTGPLVGLRYDAKPKAIAADGKGGAWFVQAEVGNPGYRLAYTNGGAYTEYLITPCPGVSPCSGTFTGTGPTDVTVATDGRVWLTNETPKEIVVFDPVATTFTHYPLSSIDPSLAAGRPFSIRKAADGTVWASIYGGPGSPGANAVVRIVPGQNGAITADVYKTNVLQNGSTVQLGPLGVSPSATGDVWIALSPPTGAGRIGRLAGVIAGGTGGGGGGGGETPAPPVPGGTIVTPTTVGRAEAGKAGTDGDTASVRQICVGPPQDKCSLIYMLDSHEYVTGFPNSNPPQAGGSRLALAPKKPKKKKGTVRLGTTSITLQGGETKTVKIRLSKKARTLLNKRGTLKAALTTYQRQPDGSFKQVAKKQVTFKKKKAKKK